MTVPDGAMEILGLPKFAAILSEVTTSSITSQFKSVERTDAAQPIDWFVALLCASAIGQGAPYKAQDAALRTVQACIADESVDPSHKQAASVLLERMGNWPALRLAADKQLIAPDAWLNVPAPMQLDVIRKRLELAVPVSGSRSLLVNTFQRQFWTEAQHNIWFSFTAPTSAGKSFIVKRWIEDRANSSDSFNCVYVVPTRALIEEVSRDFKSDERFSAVPIYTLPWELPVDSRPGAIYILTQERLHILLQRKPDFAPSLIFVDEAQKLGDKTRGILLQRVLRDTVDRNPGVQVLLASPLATNPELLLEDAPRAVTSTALVSNAVTVSQNLLWVNQERGNTRLWRMELIWDGEPKLIGRFMLAARPVNVSLRISLIACALGADKGGNVVYVNGAAEAEKVSSQIYETLGPDKDISSDQDIVKLRELIKETVHPRYDLREVITRGVAFHYGNMPLLLRSEVERLFRDGKIRFLVCTSTLLEGVNLPCSTLFTRGPRKGRGNKMTVEDFWNLAGRAGRWGKEFQGNIVCIDTSITEQWPDPPTTRVAKPLKRATSEVLSEYVRLREYLANRTPVTQSREWPSGEAIYSYLASYVGRGVDLQSIPGLGLSTENSTELQLAVTDSLASISVPYAIYSKHAGISPIAMQRLLDYFSSRDDPSELRLSAPEEYRSWFSYYRAISVVNEYLGGEFGTTQGRHQQLGILISQWISGVSLARLIEERVTYYRSSGRSMKLATIIRNTMEDVEQVARFHAPKYLGCYMDLLDTVPGGRRPTDQDLPDLAMMLELGLSRATDISMMSLGLSRSTVLLLAPYIVPDTFTPDECLAWLTGRDLDSLDLPELVRQEIREMLAQRGNSRDEISSG